MLDSLVKGPFEVVTGTLDGKMTVANARGAAAVAAVVAAFFSSKLTRSRVEEGKDPIIGFF